MPITLTYYEADGSGIAREEIKHEGCVVRLREYTANRNHSDTLDYSDWRRTKVTEALVYVGRTWKGKHGFDMESECPIEHRFQWIDCTNLFVWRGSPAARPQVDPGWVLALNAKLLEDIGAWDEIQAEQARITAQRAAERAELEQKYAEEQALNRPVPGKKMVVVKGRKVPRGFEGTVAFVTDDGRVLLKAHHEWKDRKAQGTWVAATNLKAVV